MYFLVRHFSDLADIRVMVDGTRVLLSAISLRPFQGSHACTGHTRTHVAFWECVHEWMPLCPPRFWTRRRGKDGWSREYGEGSRAVLFQQQRGRGGPFRPLHAHMWTLPASCQIWRGLLQSGFHEASPYPAFFSFSKMAETIQHGCALLSSVSFFPTLTCFSPFFSLGRKALRIQWRLSISDESFVASCGWTFILFDQRTSVLRSVKERNDYIIG